MTDYVKSTNFASKDSLLSGNPLKLVKGTELDTEFNNIATSIRTKADSSQVATDISDAITAATTTPVDANVTTGTQLSKSVLGTSFTLTGTTINTLFGSSLTQLATTITVIGRDSGARITIPLNIQKVSTF